MIRVILTNVVQGVIQRFTGTAYGDQQIIDREFFQHYGYTSRPKPGAEAIIIRDGNHFLAIASDDRRYRISLEEGEAAIYDDQGQKCHLTRDGIAVLSPFQITATAPEVTVIAETRVTIDTPETHITGTLQVDGKITGGDDIEATANIQAGADITATGNVADQGGAKTMGGMREAYNSHTHAEHGTGGGTTSTTTQGM